MLMIVDVLSSTGTILTSVEHAEGGGTAVISNWRPTTTGTHYIRLRTDDEPVTYTLSLNAP
jgi:hypothetical protein